MTLLTRERPDSQEQMGEVFAAVLDRFSSCVASQRKKPQPASVAGNMAGYAIHRQVQCGWRRSFFKRFRLINEAFHGATTHVPAIWLYVLNIKNKFRRG